MFKITEGKGFQITFENGVTVSVQWGYMNYCNNRSFDNTKINTERNNRIFKSSNAEIAIWDKNNNWITQKFKDEGDQVLGYQSPKEVLEALNWAANYKEK